MKYNVILNQEEYDLLTEFIRKGKEPTGHIFYDECLQYMGCKFISYDDVIKALTDNIRDLRDRINNDYRIIYDQNETILSYKKKKRFF